MSINFDSLPNKRPVAIVPKGTYYATIESAEMKQGQDVTKPPYLNMLLALKDKTGKSVGKIYDMLTESSSQYIKFKISRFIIALGLDKKLPATFELSDLCKIIKNKELIVDVTPEEKKDEEPKRSVIDLFGGSVYYPIAEAAEIFKTDTETKHVSLINAADAEDATPAESALKADSDDPFDF